MTRRFGVPVACKQAMTERTGFLEAPFLALQIPIDEVKVLAGRLADVGCREEAAPEALQLERLVAVAVAMYNRGQSIPEIRFAPLLRQQQSSQGLLEFSWHRRVFFRHGFRFSNQRFMKCAPTRD